MPHRAWAVPASEIRIGNTNAYSDPASASSVLGKLPAAYFRKVNERGGINGRKIVYFGYGDACSPPKTVSDRRFAVLTGHRVIDRQRCACTRRQVGVIDRGRRGYRAQMRWRGDNPRHR